MVRTLSRLGVATLLVVLVELGLAATPASAQLVRSAAGADAASIQATVDTFRADLGALNPNVVGSFPSGRREINWDGVPDALAAPNALPGNFFNADSPRGALFSTPGTSLQVSANAGVAPVRFDNINATYSATFSTFSPQRLFTAIGSNVVDVTFVVPGTNEPAAVSGFGAVFTDVDLPNTTSLEFFGAAGNSLGTFFVPNIASSSATQSFLGVVYDGAVIARVRIISGNAALGPNDNNGAPVDVVVMDDFIYGEPQTLVSKPALVRLSTTRILGSALANGGGTPTTFTYGNRPLTPLFGDWDGDGTKTAGTFEAGTFRLNNANDSSAAEHTFAFGDPRGFAVAGDFDFDGDDDVGVYRNGLWQLARVDGTPMGTETFGSGAWPATVPVTGDWNGDGFDDIGTYTYASATWNLLNAVTNSPIGLPFVFGTPNASYPVVGDWNGDGIDTVGVKTGTTWTLRNSNNAGVANITFDFGLSSDLPMTWR